MNPYSIGTFVVFAIFLIATISSKDSGVAYFSCFMFVMMTIGYVIQSGFDRYALFIALGAAGFYLIGLVRAKYSN